MSLDLDGLRLIVVPKRNSKRRIHGNEKVVSLSRSSRVSSSAGDGDGEKL